MLRRIRVWLRTGGVCYICGEMTRLSDFTVDHIKPKSKGGKWEISNLAATHHRCNLWKGNRVFLYQREVDRLRPRRRI